MYGPAPRQAAGGQANTRARPLSAKCSQRLGACLAMLIDLLNPQKIVIGSIYARAEKWFRETALRVIEEEALIYPRQVCSIVPAALGVAIGDVAALSVAIHGQEMGA